MAEAQGADAAQGEPVQFRAEVKQLLHILAHSLYTDREIFLRELISNASDALHRLQFEMLTNHDVVDPERELAIRISFDAEARTLTIEDNGIGMNRQEMIDHLGTIAQSGARRLMEQLEAAQRSQIIGQFGVGFYSAFVVADRVRVESRSFRPADVAATWSSTGDDLFLVGAAERTARGTSVTLHLKEDAADFASEWRLREVIRRHSEFVSFPIYLGDTRVNQQTALWRTQPRDVKPEQYTEFYRQLTLDNADPLARVHLSTDVPVDLHAILYVPSKRERGLFERRVEGAIKLYSRKVLIQENAKGLLPEYLRFVEGVVDSEDLPLSVSREGAQSSPIQQRIRQSLTGRLTKALADLAEKDAAAYANLWREFGVFFKEGVALEYSARDDLLPLLRFHTNTAGDDLVSFADYVGRMVDGQAEIYYLIAPDLETARRSAHLDALQARGLEALLLVDPMDAFMLQGLREFDGKPLRNLDDPDLELPGEADATSALVDDATFGRLVARCTDVLGERVTGVRASRTLRDSPARLVAAAGAANADMDRVRRFLERDHVVAARLLELNRGHHLIADIARLQEDSANESIVRALVEQLYDNALLLEGLHANPAAMVERIQALMAAAASRGGAAG